MNKYDKYKIGDIKSTVLNIDGKFYSDNKRKFKKILKENDILWKGNWAHGIFVWKGDNIIVNCDYERSEEKTEKVILTITCDNEEVIREIQEWAQEGLVEDTKLQDIKDDWESKIDYEKKMGAPDGFLNAMRRKCEKEVKECQEKMMC